MPNPTPAETIAEYFAAIRAMDPDRFVATFAPTATSEDPVGAPPMHGHAAIHAFLAGMATLFTEIDLTPDAIFPAGNSAAIKWTATGTGRNGAKVNFQGVDVIDCGDDGKIVKIRAFWDPAPVLAAVQG